MTYSDYGKLEEQCKNDTLGKCIDVDMCYGGQCWDLNQLYNIKYLNVPAYVLGGCGTVDKMLVEPKLSDLLRYFDEVPANEMIKGDIAIWNYGHIAIYDSWDGQFCWFLTQNNPVEQMTTISILNTDGMRSFRLKGVLPDPEPTPEPPVDLLDLVRRTIRGDFGNGQERINALGNLYEQVQYQVEQNLSHGLTNWDDIRLF